MPQKKIIFVNPAKTEKKTAFQYVKFGKIPSLNLAILASFVPGNWKIKIIDESIEEVIPERCNILALSSMTAQIKRAEEIATIFRKKYPQAKVLIGGIHATVKPHEVKKWADVVVVGEAEEIFKKIIVDFERGKLKRIYKSQNPELSKVKKLPRFDLLRLEKYRLWPLQTTRGCPFGCDFCSVWKIFGKKARHFSLDYLKKQIHWYKTREKFLSPVVYFIIDDNIFADSAYALKLFRLLKKERIKWFAQASIPICFNKKALDLAGKSGCQALFIGFESILQLNLESVHKKYQIEKYWEAVDNCHKAGICVYGAFILGFENDSLGIGEKTANFALNINLDLAQTSILTPLPGTVFFERVKSKLYLEEQKRIKNRDWSYFDTSYSLWKHKKLSKKQLEEEFCSFYKTFYNFKHLTCLLKSITKRSFFQNALFFAANLDFWQGSKAIIKNINKN